MENGDSIEAGPGLWNFGNGVEEVFDKHIIKSVPGYQLSHFIVSLLSDPFIRKESKIVDLGCSTGTLCRLLEQRHKDKFPKIIGIDNQKNMIQKASEHDKSGNIEYLVSDITVDDLPINIDMAITFYTLQFIAPSVRQTVVNKIYESLNWGGGLFVFEKVRGPDARFQDYINHAYMNFKLQNFNPNEVVNKAKSIIGVMEPFSTQGNLDMLKRAGFKDICTITKLLCFEGFLAIK